MLPDAREPPGKGRRFYAIQDNEDGTVDVYLMPEVSVYPIPDGFKEHEREAISPKGLLVLPNGKTADGSNRRFEARHRCVRVVRGVVPTEDLESDIRARFMAWCESAEVVDL